MVYLAYACATYDCRFSPSRVQGLAASATDSSLEASMFLLVGCEVAVDRLALASMQALWPSQTTACVCLCVRCGWLSNCNLSCVVARASAGLKP